MYIGGYYLSTIWLKTLVLLPIRYTSTSEARQRKTHTVDVRKLKTRWKLNLLPAPFPNLLCITRSVSDKISPFTLSRVIHFVYSFPGGKDKVSRRSQLFIHPNRPPGEQILSTGLLSSLTLLE